VSVGQADARGHERHGREVVFQGKGLVEVRREPPPALGAGEALVRVSRSLISSGTEMIVLDRLFDDATHWDDWVEYPFRAGYSCAGRVLEINGHSDRVAVGDRVALRGFHGDYAVAALDSLIAIPDEVSDEDAAWLGLGCISQVALRHAEPQLGATVAVVGAGLLGQLLIQYSRVMGAADVISIDPAQTRLDFARRHGATDAVRANAHEALDPLAELTGGRMADIVYDATGHADAFAGATRLATRFGRVVLMGDTGSRSATVELGAILLGGLTVVGAHDGHPPEHSSAHSYWSHQRMSDLFLELVRRGDMVVGSLTTHRFPGGRASEAYELLRERRSEVVGVILDWELEE
jgi:threonine dehydrogenase-like Zn-dependent dehydrogenase